MASAAFERFRFSFFEDTNSARNGFDTVASPNSRVKRKSKPRRCSSHVCPTLVGSSGWASCARAARSPSSRYSLRPSGGRISRPSSPPTTRNSL